MAKRTDYQKRADKAYYERMDKEVLKYRNYKSKTKTFINNLATADDLTELQNLIAKKLKESI